MFVVAGRLSTSTEVGGRLQLLLAALDPDATLTTPSTGQAPLAAAHRRPAPGGAAPHGAPTVRLDGYWLTPEQGERALAVLFPDRF
jgi:hypothetical protein